MISDRKRRSSKVPDISRLLLVLAYTAVAPQGASQVLDGSIIREACLLPVLVGGCRSAMTRYHFNYTTAACTIFLYGGCSGNANNFVTEQDCLLTCMPPTLSVAGSMLRTDAAPALALQYRGVPAVDSGLSAVTVPLLSAQARPEPDATATPAPQAVAGNSAAAAAHDMTVGVHGNVTVDTHSKPTAEAHGNMTVGTHRNETLVTADLVQVIIDVEHIGYEVPHVISIEPTAQPPPSASTVTSPLTAAATPLTVNTAQPVLEPAPQSASSSVGSGPVAANNTVAAKPAVSSLPASSALPMKIQVWTLIVAGVTLVVSVW